MVDVMTGKVTDAELHVHVVPVARPVVMHGPKCPPPGVVLNVGVDVIPVIVPVIIGVPLIYVHPDGPILLLGYLGIPSLDELLDN